MNHKVPIITAFIIKYKDINFYLLKKAEKQSILIRL